MGSLGPGWEQSDAGGGDTGPGRAMPSEGAGGPTCEGPLGKGGGPSLVGSDTGGGKSECARLLRGVGGPGWQKFKAGDMKPKRVSP